MRLQRGHRPTPDDSPRPGASLRFLTLLGLPTLALALGLTTVSTFMPVLLEELAGPAVIGLLIASEGLLALVIPVMVGPWSDRVSTRIGRRMPFLIGGALLAVVALVGLPLAGSLPAIALLLLVFYAGYFTYYSPYRALYPELVSPAAWGRSQGIQNTLREVGLGLALIGGGLLLGLWQPLPFLMAALVLAVVTVSVVALVREPGDQQASEPAKRDRGLLSLVRGHGAVRRVLLANALWEFALAAMRTFGILFFTVGLGRSPAFASAAFAVVAVAVVAAALAGGALADRVGPLRVVRAALWVYGFGLLIPLVTTSAFALAIVPVVAVAAGVVMTLPYTLLLHVAPGRRHGAAAGLFELSRGVGILLGPLAAGAAIEVAQPVFAETQGYIAIFGVAAVGVLLSIPLLRGLDAAGRA